MLCRKPCLLHRCRTLRARLLLHRSGGLLLHRNIRLLLHRRPCLLLHSWPCLLLYRSGGMLHRRPCLLVLRRRAPLLLLRWLLLRWGAGGWDRSRPLAGLGSDTIGSGRMPLLVRSGSLLVGLGSS